MTKAKRLLFLGNDAPVYINLLSFGGCEATTGWDTFSNTISADDSNKYEGTYCLKTAGNGAAVALGYRSIYSLINKTKHYLVSGYVKRGTTTRIAINCGPNYYTSELTTGYKTSTEWTRAGLILTPDYLTAKSSLLIITEIYGAPSGVYGYYDALMLNEITAADYAAGVAACLAKYPYKAYAA